MGRVISGRYEELLPLGQGGQGVVYKVRHVEHRTLLALKVLPAALLEDEERAARFEQEAALLTRLRHRNIVQVLGSGRDEALKLSYIVMEYVHGTTLRQYLREKGPLPLPEVLEFARQVADALAYAHSQTPPIIHRDIKPTNLMIEENSGRIVVLDFGIAKELVARDTGQTQTGRMLGTWKYCAPEQLRHEPLTGSVDVYALGLVMYEMYTATPFFGGLEEHEVLGKVLHDPWEQEPYFSRPTHPAFVALVSKAIAKSRDKRYRGMAELLNDLEACWWALDETKTLALSGVGAIPSQPDPGPEDIRAIEQQIRQLTEERQRRVAVSAQAQVQDAKARAATSARQTEPAPIVTAEQDIPHHGTGKGNKTVAIMISDVLREVKAAQGGRFGSMTVFMRKILKQGSSPLSRRLWVAMICLAILLVQITAALVYVNYGKRQEPEKMAPIPGDLEGTREIQKQILEPQKLELDEQKRVLEEQRRKLAESRELSTHPYDKMNNGKGGAQPGKTILPPATGKANLPPKITQRSPTQRQVTIGERESVNFSVSAFDPDGDTIGYSWYVDRKPTAQRDRFAFTTSTAGSHRIDLEVTDTNGLKDVFWWEVKVEAPPAAPRLVMYTPYKERIRLSSHLSRFFGVEVEAPGMVEPLLRYEWKIDGRPVAGHELFEFKNQAPGQYEIEVMAINPSDASVSHRWTVEVQEKQDEDTHDFVGPPYLELLELANEISADKRQVVVRGKIRNVDDHAAENVIVWVSALDHQRGAVFRRLVLPAPQPLSPGYSATFQTAFSNRDEIAGFHAEIVSK